MEEIGNEAKPGQVAIAYDCGPKCKSKQHALELIRAVSKGTTEQAILFLSLCHKAEATSDEYGRTALHVAASCGKLDVLSWLLERGASVSAVDKESAWTALHRAVFYGQLNSARLLISHASSLSIRDREGLSPLDLLMKDRPAHVEYQNSGLNELYTWGVNANCTLGHDSLQPKKLPERVDFFRKQSISVKSVVIGKYHGVFLTNSGHVYTCGHGLGGRLGHNHKTSLVPEMVEGLKDETCVQIAASYNHTVLLTASFKVFTCGLNNFGQLGYQACSEGCITPKPIAAKYLKGKEFLGVCAGRYHTVLYTRDTVYTCGLNAGQIGHGRQPNEIIIHEPRIVSGLVHKDTVINLVASSDAATVVATQRGDVFALHDYQCVRIIAKWVNIVQIGVVGGRLDPTVAGSIVNTSNLVSAGSAEIGELSRICERGAVVLTVFVLTSTGQLYIWKENDTVPRRCVWSIHRPLSIIQFSASISHVAVVTKDGEVFTSSVAALLAANSRQMSLKSASSFTAPRNKEWVLNYSPTLSDLVDRDDVVQLKLNRVSLVHRANAVFIDTKGQNFAVLQAHPSACVTSIPSVSASDMQKQLTTLFMETSTADDIQDVTLQVGMERIYCHRYILSSKSDYFQKLFLSSSENVNLKQPAEFKLSITSAEDILLFKQLLKFIYTESCDLLVIGTSIDFVLNRKFKKSDKTSKNNDCSKDFDYSTFEDDRSINEISAYEVKAKSKSRGKKKSSDTSVEVISAAADAFSRFRELAREYGVKTIMKRLDCLYCLNGMVAWKKRCSFPAVQPKFQINSIEGVRLADVCLQSENGKTFDCHKCILVARSEYFSSMFNLSWSEMSAKSSVKLMIPGEILHAVLEYLYTDNSLTVSGSDDAEFVCNVLAVADQLLIGRLKELCEVALSQLLTLRNAADMLEFSSMCGAEQLKETCQQFICINLAAIMESRSLDRLSEDVMSDLSQYYRLNTLGMDRRVITPYAGWPEVELLESLEEEMNQSFDPSSSAKKNKPRKKRTRTKSDSKEPSPELGEASRGTDMVSSPLISRIQAIEEINEENASEDIGSSEAGDNGFDRHFDMSALSKRWSHRPQHFIMSETYKAATPVDARKSSTPSSSKQYISSFSLENNESKAGATPSAFSNTPRREMDSRTRSELSMNSRNNGEIRETRTLRDIMHEEEVVSQSSGVPNSSGQPSVKKQPKKMSQKERKMQGQTEKSQGQSDKQQTGCGGNENPIKDGNSIDFKDTASTKSNPWKTIGTVVESFREMILNETKGIKDPSTMTVLTPKHSTKPSAATPIDIPTKVETRQQNGGLSLNPSLASSPEKSCWGLPLSREGRSLKLRSSVPGNSESTSPLSPSGEYQWFSKSPTEAVKFADILHTEQQQSETLQRTSNKPLAHIQREERAISRLLEMYGAEVNINEYVTVERVHASCTRPLWAATQRQRTFL